MTLLAVVSLGAALYFASAVFLPAAVAFFLAILLEPLVSRLSRWGLGRKLSAFVGFFVFWIALGLALWVFYRSFANIVMELPRYEEKLKSTTRSVDDRVQLLRRQTQGVLPHEGQGVERVQVLPNNEQQYVRLLGKGLGSLAQTASIAVFVPFLSLFLLMEKAPLLRALSRAAGVDFDLRRLERDVPRMVHAYFFGNIIVGFAMSILQWAVFKATGLENAVGLALVTGFVNVIPILGLPVALVLALAQALLQFQTAGPYVAIAAAIVVLHIANANWIEPRVIGARVRLNSFAAVLAMLFWWWMWGATGFLLSIPLAALLRLLLESHPRSARWAELLSMDGD